MHEHFLGMLRSRPRLSPAAVHVAAVLMVRHLANASDALSTSKLAVQTGRGKATIVSGASGVVSSRLVAKTAGSRDQRRANLFVSPAQTLKSAGPPTPIARSLVGTFHRAHRTGRGARSSPRS
jgi:hypothetical protein